MSTLKADVYSRHVGVPDGLQCFVIVHIVGMFVR